MISTACVETIQIWHKAVWIRPKMRLEVTREGLLDYLANHDTTLGAPFWSSSILLSIFLRCNKGRKNGARYKTRTHLWKFVSQTC